MAKTSFVIKDDDVLDKYSEIQDKIKEKSNIKFHRLPIYDEKYIKIPYFGIHIHRNIEIYMNILHNLTHRKIHFPIHPEKYILTHSLTQRRKSRFPSTWIITGSFLFAWSFLAYPWFSHLGWGWNNVISSHMLQSYIYIYTP